MNTDLRGFTGSRVLLASRFQSGPITGHAIDGDGASAYEGSPVPPAVTTSTLDL
ncbi:hypothetical protein PV726_37145 [Streptomyces europaeiscabiei]|uniref:hypothetical protein n=1 Tax=Streptomyces europaeiscabiei TaxID=146819 RepID=UPI0029AD5D81|nr:hypothetical protein [Streptomyces europaeiscabiei]MDX3695848.1 hypothetical protein [Streptomyces europaeiscabiei]